jgi:hypothetical protein
MLQPYQLGRKKHTSEPQPYCPAKTERTWFSNANAFGRIFKTICKDPELKRNTIPFVFYSTAANESQINRAFDVTVQGFFLKGQSLEEIERRMKIILDYWSESMHPNLKSVTNIN